MAQQEFEIIENYFKNSGLGFERAGIDIGIGDDCAVLSPDPDQQLAISMDLLQEGIHFPESSIPELIAQRALAVNLSDLAAMGAEPLCFTLGLSLPEANETWLEAFSRGLLKLAKRYNCPLVGGDLIRGNLHLAIQVHGQFPKGQGLLRSTAKPGHLIYVTGTLGDGAAALALLDSYNGLVYKAPGLSDSDEKIIDKTRLSSAQRDYLINAFYCPEPQIEAGIALRGIASSAIDLSDGLISDLGHILQTSGVGAEIDMHQIPLSEPFKAAVSENMQHRLALAGGDDYQLCFTVAPENCDEVEKSLAKAGIKISRIGEIVTGEKLMCMDSQGEPLDIDYSGYNHFGEETL